MKKFLKFIVCFILVCLVAGLAVAKPVKTKKNGNKKRAASTSSGLVSAKAKEKKAKSSKSSTSSKKTKLSSLSGKKSGSSKGKDKAKEEEGEQLPAPERCMVDNLEALLNGECKFLNNPELLAGLSGKFYCLYNYKDKSKLESVYNYYLYQNYGVREVSLKDGDANVEIKNPSRTLNGASKYYEFLLDGLEKGNLAEGKILDFLTEEVLDDEASLTSSEMSAIQKVSVEKTVITMDVTKKDIEQCREATKKIVSGCALTVDENNKIASNCEEYNSALIKNASANKAKVLDLKPKIADVLRQRVETVRKTEEAEAAEKEKEKEKKAAAAAAADSAGEVGGASDSSEANVTGGADSASGATSSEGEKDAGATGGDAGTADSSEKADGVK